MTAQLSLPVAKPVLTALNDGKTDAKKLTLVADELDATRIQSPAEVEALPELNENEVCLVVWMTLCGTRNH